MGGGGNRPLVKRRASLQRLCPVRLYRDIPGTAPHRGAIGTAGNAAPGSRLPATPRRSLWRDTAGGFCARGEKRLAQKATALAVVCLVWWCGLVATGLRDSARVGDEDGRFAERHPLEHSVERRYAAVREDSPCSHWSRAIEASTLWRTFTVLSGRAAPKRLRWLTSQQRKLAGTRLGLKADAQQAGPLLRGGQ
jgi:hypothetical protein